MINKDGSRKDETAEFKRGLGFGGVPRKKMLNGTKFSVQKVCPNSYIYVRPFFSKSQKKKKNSQRWYTYIT